MIEIDWQRCGTVPKDHQKVGTRSLLQWDDPAKGRTVGGVFLLADEVGCGKSKQQIDACEFLYDTREIDTVVALAPAQGRAVWADSNPEIGEVSKHGHPSVDNYILEYSVRYPKLKAPEPGHLLWLVSNYEFIRRPERLAPVLQFLSGRRFWLVCDEAWALSDASTDQWKATHKIRRMAKRVTLLNGTPVTDSPLDLFAQMKMLDPEILGFKYFMHFRARYAMMKPNTTYPCIIGWQHLEELRAKIEPYTLARKTDDCWDLPPVLDPVTVEVRLTDKTWLIYKQMRDEMVAWLSVNPDNISGQASVAKQAIVKAMRLAQITSGFVGGVQQIDEETGDLLDFGTGTSTTVEEIGTEKLDALQDYLARLRPIPNRWLIWSRFRLEIERTAKALSADRRVLKLYGEQSRTDREAALAALNPGIPQDEPVGVVGNPLAGGAAVNLAGASTAMTLSQDTKLRVYLQARGRVRRPGQIHPIRYVDFVATGPKGQRTIDHHIVAALRGKEDIATWTTATWSRILREE